MVSFVSEVRSLVFAFLFEPQKPAKRYHNIDFLRIVFCFGILLYHVVYATGFHKMIAEYGGCFRVAVNGFFILSGFLMYSSVRKGKFADLKAFTIAKIARLWPVFAFSELLFLVFSKCGLINTKFHFEHEFLSLFFIKDIGFNYFGDLPKYLGLWGTNAHVWYLGPLFWGMIICFILLQKVKEQKNVLNTVAMMVFILFCCSIITHHSEALRAFSRGVGFLSMGILFGITVEYAKNKGFCISGHDVKTILIKLLFTLVEFFIMYRMYHIMFRRRYDQLAVDYYLVYGILFCILIYLFIFDLGYIGRILNRKIFSVIGAWGYSVYIMQYIVQQTIIPAEQNKLYAYAWFRDFTDNYTFLTFCIYIAVCFLLGALAHYFIEKPCYKKIMDKFGGKKSN